MITFFNIFRMGLIPVYVFIAILVSSVTLVSCNKDELKIQHNFPFEVKVMPVPKEVANGSTLELRITIERTGNYNDRQYFIRYFQFDGQGALRYYNEPAYLQNDLYSLPTEQFRLYYTSHSTVSQSFDVWISDNFGNEKQLTFQFNNKD